MIEDWACGRRREHCPDRAGGHHSRHTGTTQCIACDRELCDCPAPFNGHAAGCRLGRIAYEEYMSWWFDPRRLLL